MIPYGDEQLQAGDVVVAFYESNCPSLLQSLLTNPPLLYQGSNNGTRPWGHSVSPVFIHGRLNDLAADRKMKVF